jgi:hypothetical protein
MVLNVLRSRKFARRVLMAVLIIIIPAFVFWGVGSFTDRPEPVGRIFGRTISLEDFMNSQQGVKIQILLNYFGDYDTMSRILRNRDLVNSMAWERLVLLGASREEKVEVTNEEVMTFIATHPLFQRGGSFDREVYASLLRNPMISVGPRQFEELVRQNLQVQLYRDMLLKDISIEDEEIFEEFARTNDKVSLSYFIIDKDSFSEDIAVPQEDVRGAYDRNRELFFSPEKIEIEYMEFSYSDLAEKAEIMRVIEDAYRKIETAPHNFDSIADELDARYGKTGFFTRNDIIPNVTFFRDLHEAAFAIEKDQVSVPLFSDPEKGKAYIIRKTASIEPEPLSFEDVKEDLTSAVMDAKSIEMAQAEAELIYENISDGEISFEQAAKEKDLTIRDTGVIGPEDLIDNIGPARDIVAAAREAEKGSVIRPMVSKRGALVIRVDDVMPADASELTPEKKEALRKDLLTREQIDKLDTWFRDRASDVKVFRPIEEM